jgi:hypothetical protein
MTTLIITLNKRLRSLNNPYFVVALILLLANDFYFKFEYHNWVTGKLSDLTGLFVFVLFWTAIIPHKKDHVYVCTALLFVFWKSPWSQPFIDFFSDQFYPIDRVVDPADLVALLILPVAYQIDLDRTSTINFAAFPVAALTIFSFCATSRPMHMQVFDPPVYVLIRHPATAFPYNAHLFDSLEVIEVDEVPTAKYPAIDDSFYKSQVLKDLDVTDDSTGLLPPDRRTSLTVKVDSFTDELNFLGSRQHGSYKRYSGENELLIDGYYKRGLEDSVWTFYEKDKPITRKTFQNAELIKIEKFENGKLVTQSAVSTRGDAILRQYIILTIIIAIMIFLVSALVKNYRRSNEPIALSNKEKIGLILISPTVLYIIARLLLWAFSASPNDFSLLIFLFVGANFFGIPFFIIIFYGIQLRHRHDLALYSFFFMLLIIGHQELIFLKMIL